MENYILYQLGDFYSSGDDDAIFSESFASILAFKDRNGISNMERIYSQYGYIKKAEYKADYDAALTKIKAGQNPNPWPHNYIRGTIIAVPPKWLNLEIAARDGGSGQVIGNDKNDRFSDSNVYYGAQLQRLLDSEVYLQTTKLTSAGAVIRDPIEARVFAWCRALTTPYEGEIESDELEGRWIEVTDFVRSVNTTVTESGGSFSVELSPVTALYNAETESWEPDVSTLKLSRNSVVGRTNLYRQGKKATSISARTPLLFEFGIQENDLFAIRFESDQRDSRQSGLIDPSSYTADYHAASAQAQDMLALVDTVTKSLSPGSNDISITVEGRDLSKLLIEDGSFMYASLWDGHNFFLEREGGLLERTFGQNGNQVYRFFTEPKFHSVAEGVLFILNNLTNITIIPDEIAENYYRYNDERVSQGTLDKSTTTWDNAPREVETAAQTELKGLVKQCLTLYNDNSTSWSGELWDEYVDSGARRMVLIANSLDTDPVTGVYNISYSDYQDHRALRENELSFPEFPGNATLTYRGGKVGGYLDPATGFNTASVMTAALKISNQIKSEEPIQTISSKNLGIWGFVRVLFDDDIAKRKLVDTSLGSPDGSLVELIWNWVQMPWVELLMDTNGHSYNLIFRTPPIDRARITQMIKEPWFADMAVDDTVVLSESLSFDTEVYSLYKLNYKAASWGTQDNLSAVIPVVPLPDYAEEFGARRWEQSSNLIPVSQVDDSTSLINRSYVRDKGIEDLTWVIETTAYLPFTRTGTITIHGDRRFKRGLWFHYKPTNEVFYITEVSHSYTNAETIDFTTTLSVRRGMVKDYIEGSYITTKDHGEVELSYFDIINIENLSNFLKEQLKVEVDGEVENQPKSDSESNFRVIPEVFNFFRKRLQFAVPGQGPAISTRANERGQDVSNIA